ncbi:MAG: hypothetical protein NTZ25_02775 [Candidatus Peregrinibacteria bacterium]|nr:hypothetical protein [Candidatus Peregrinibacteria bacterium]
MKSQILKYLLVIILSAGIAGGGVYYWQQSEGKKGEDNKEAKTTEEKLLKEEVKEPAKEVTKESPASDLFELAKTTKDEFTYIVSSSKLNGDWKVVVNNNFKNLPMRFSFKYQGISPWGEIRYIKSDLTASDGAAFTDLQGISSYRFCAGNYYCDDTKNEGMGFNLTFWNSKFKGKVADPKFYLKNGGTLFKETDNYIITYKPFTGDKNVEKEVANIMSTFEIF